MPAGEYFMMGDNRDNSTDSRFSQVGTVPFENFVGRAQIIFFSVYEGERAWEFWRWPSPCAGAGCSRSCDEPQGQGSDQGARCARGRRSGIRFADKDAARARAHAYFRACPAAAADRFSYQRLEFLGDHVLGLVDLRHAVSRLSARRMRANCRAASPIWCARKPAPMSRGPWTSARRCGSAARKSGRRRPLARHHSGGRLRSVGRRRVHRRRLPARPPSWSRNSGKSAWMQPARPLRDPKTMLQEWAQARGLPTPAYQRSCRAPGPQHNPKFKVVGVLAGARAGGRHWAPPNAPPSRPRRPRC